MYNQNLINQIVLDYIKYTYRLVLAVLLVPADVVLGLKLAKSDGGSFASRKASSIIDGTVLIKFGNVIL